MDEALSLPWQVGLREEGSGRNVPEVCGQTDTHWFTAVLGTQPAESKEGEGASSGPCASLQPASHVCAAATGALTVPCTQ